MSNCLRIRRGTVSPVIKLTDNIHGAQCGREGAKDSDQRGIAMREEVHTAQCGRAADRVHDRHKRAVQGVRDPKHDLHFDDVGQHERVYSESVLFCSSSASRTSM